MSYDWHQLKVHNGLIETQTKVRISYFISQAYISAIQGITKKVDGLSYSGTPFLKRTFKPLKNVPPSKWNCIR